MPQHQVITIHPQAPAKPPVGAPCNGCGLCCLLEPCPVGMLVSRRRRGACAALRWIDAPAPVHAPGGTTVAGRPAPGRYACGLLHEPGAWLPRWLQAPGMRGNRLAAGLLARLARRCISAGTGCDAAIEVVG